MPRLPFAVSVRLARLDTVGLCDDGDDDAGGASSVRPTAPAANRDFGGLDLTAASSLAMKAPIRSSGVPCGVAGLALRAPGGFTLVAAVVAPRGLRVDGGGSPPCRRCPRGFGLALDCCPRPPCARVAAASDWPHGGDSARLTCPLCYQGNWAWGHPPHTPRDPEKPKSLGNTGGN